MALGRRVRFQNLYLVGSFFVIFFRASDHVIRVYGFDVGVEGAFLRVAFLADFADEGPLARVFAHVVVQISLGARSVLARLALERLLPRVDTHVDLDRLLLRETLSAHVAVIWPLARMCP